MRHAILLIITSATACSFELGATGGVDASPNVEGDDSTSVDAAPMQDGAQADAPPAQVVCTTSDGSLKLCLEFEDPALGTALDGSGLAHHAAVSGATVATREIPSTSRAIGVTTTAAIMIPDTTDLDLQTVTMTAWVQRSSLPTNGQRFGIVDVGRRQAALAIDDQGRVNCFVKTSTTIWVGIGGSTAAGEWALLACTYDAPTLCAYSFRNGSATPSVTCGETDGETLDTSSSAGSTIGALFDTSNNPSSRLKGNLDSVRIYSRTLSETELCTAGGLSGC